MTPSDMNRREFVTLGIQAGFALAVTPVAAWAITTSSEGISAGEIRIPVEGGAELPAYRAMPKGKGPFPTVLVIQEIFGVHEYIQDVCRRLAREGYLAVAPSLFFRQGDVTKMEDMRQIISQVVSKVPQAQVLSDLDAAVKWLGLNSGADAKRLAITGFCWGGNVVWMYSAHHPALRAAAAWYGKIDPPATPLQPRSPLQIASELKVPVLGLYGGKDKGIPVSDVEKMKAALARGGSGSEIIVYPEAEHGFHADYRPSYHEKAARAGWERMLAWFRKHGVK